MFFLKQSTAATIKIGPFLDSTDAVTPETGLTIEPADVRLSKEGGDYLPKNQTDDCVHDENGEYDCSLNITDTDTLGSLKLAVFEAGALPVWHEFMILSATAYDTLVTGSLTGDYVIALTINDQASNPVVDVTVQIWNSDESTLMTFGITNSTGLFNFRIDAGTYVVKIVKVGYSFDDQSLVVAADTSATYSGISLTITVPADARLCRVYEFTLDPDNSPVAELSSIGRIVSLPYDSGSALHTGDEIEGIYDVDTGMVYWDMPRGAGVVITITGFGINKKIIVPDQASARLTDIT